MLLSRINPASRDFQVFRAALKLVHTFPSADATLTPSPPSSSASPPHRHGSVDSFSAAPSNPSLSHSLDDHLGRQDAGASPSQMLSTSLPQSSSVLRRSSCFTRSEGKSADPSAAARWTPVSSAEGNGYRRHHMRTSSITAIPFRPQRWFSSSTAWNAEYQTLLDAKSSAEKYQRLAALGRDFVQCAQIYGRVILSELHLPPAQKTIKPVSIGGVAGGEKFLIKSILFKLAKDAPIPSRTNQTLWMYGGQQPDHERAIKAAGQELKGATQYHNCGIKGLRTPLMALITFNGFRLIAQSLVPISKETLQYGSCDGGHAVSYTHLRAHET